METYVCLVLLFVLYKLLDRLIRVPRVSTSGRVRNIVVTGCDSGFGNLFTKKMDRPGFQVFAACLTSDGLRNLNTQTSNRVKTFLMDVTDTTSIEKGVAFVQSHLTSNEGVDALVNNAGVATSQGPIEWMRKEHYESVLSVNLYGVIETSRLFIPLLQRSGRGRVVNTASILGRLAFPYGAPYTISKHGVEAFSDCLRREVRQFNISVHIIEPGYFRTAMTKPSNLVESLKKFWEPLPSDIKKRYGKSFTTEMTKDLQTFLDRHMSDSVDEVVSSYEHAVTAVFPRARYMVGYDARLVFWPLSLLPEWVSDFLMSPFLTKARPE